MKKNKNVDKYDRLLQYCGGLEGKIHNLQTNITAIQDLLIENKLLSVEDIQNKIELYNYKNKVVSELIFGFTIEEKYQPSVTNYVREVIFLKVTKETPMIESITITEIKVEKQSLKEVKGRFTISNMVKEVDIIFKGVDVQIDVGINGETDWVSFEDLNKGSSNNYK